MTIEEFHKNVIKKNYWERCWFYFLYSTIIAAWCYFFYDALTNPAKYDMYGTRYYAIFGSVILIYFGIRGLILIPNRYKVITLKSSIPLNEKHHQIFKFMEAFENPAYTLDGDILQHYI